MSTTVDQRVVEMRFDNKDFETNVATSISTLDKLKQSLNINGAAKGLENINAAANKCDLRGLSGAIDTVQAKFSALQVVGITTIANLTNSAVNAGKRMVSALTIDPIKTGFQEYETQINAVQTILANTESKGSTLKDVNAALDELNVYADKTIYNFTEMTRNIGTFTAAGVGLKESTSAIQGIANVAAVSGSTSQQASIAMYQLSQALASGTVKLQDWNSVVNAGMGGQVFQDALKKTAKAHGVAVDELIKKHGSFRESLQEGWITSEVLTETLAKMTQTGAAEYLAKLTGVSQKQIEAVQKEVDACKDGTASYDELAKTLARTGKVSEEEAVEILKMADTATNAATKVKTFTQLWDTLKEAAQSGWTQTWEIIVGDFEEAKELMTNISDVVSEMINKSAEARNSVLQGWKDLGGRKDLIDSFKNTFEAIVSVVKPIGEAFNNIFPPVTAQTLVNITSALKDFTSKLIVSEETADKIKRTFQGVFAVFDILRKALLVVGNAISGFLGGGAVSGIIDMLLSFTAAIGDFFTAIDKNLEVGGFSKAISSITSSISGAIGFITKGIGGFGDALSSIGKTIGDVFGDVWNSVKDVFGWISENVSATDILAGIAGGGIVVTVKKLLALLEQAKGLLDGGLMGLIFGGGEEDPAEQAKSFKESFADILGSVNESLQAFTTGIKVASVVAIAVAIGILAHSLKTISEIELGDTVKSLGAMGGMMAMLSLTFKSITKIVDAAGTKGIIKAGITLILVAEAIKILSDALAKMGKLSLPELATGLIGVGGSLLILCGALKLIDKVKIPLKTTISLLALAECCKILATAMEKFSALSWDEIARGLTAMGGALAELIASVAVLNKISGVKSIIGSASMTMLVNTLDEIADSLVKFGGMSWKKIARGLTAMGGALAELVIVVGVLSKVSKFSSIIGSTSITIVTESLDAIADALQKFGFMSWEEIGRGLTGMGGALAEISIACGALGKIAGFSSLFGAGAILTVVQGLGDIADALQEIGYMSWEEVESGLVGMGGALAEVAVACGALGKLGGFSSLFGAGAILIVIQGLGDLADAFTKFGEMDWDSIQRGLVGMGGALLEVGGACGALGEIAGFSSLFGAGSILIVIQGLGDLADAFKKFGEMDWESIGRGLVGMGGALGEVAIISGALGSLAGLPALLGGGAILVAVQGLGDLADAFKKFGEMDWDSIQRALVAMGGAMGETALGGLLNTFSGFGAGAISTIAEPLGTLADSVKKWSGVTVPEGLGEQLGILADGVGKFIFAGLGADAISTVAAPLGTLADSVQKWVNVQVPEGIGEQLETLSSGIGSFGLVFASGWSIDTVAGPLGTLADSVSKWSKVKVPEDLGTQLETLSGALSGFSWLFTAGWSMSAITGPLGDLADSVTKWKEVKVPADLGEQLTRLSEGVSSLSISFGTGATIVTMSGPLGTLADSVKKFNGIKIPKGLGDSMEKLGTAVSDLAGKLTSLSNVDVGKVSSFADAVEKLSSTVGKASSAKTKGVDKFVEAVNKLGNIKVDGDALASTASKVSSSVSSMMKSISKSVSSSKSSISSSMSTAMSGASSAIKDSTSSVTSAATSLVDGMNSAISSKKSSTTSAFKSLASGAASAVRTNHSSMVSAGGYLGDGLVSGIKAKESAAYWAGYRLGQKAVKGEKDGQKSKSPSRETMKAGKWLGEGLIIGMEKMGSAVYDAGHAMGKKGAESISTALNLLSTIDESDMDIQPTIRPVLDLSDVSSGASAINDMLAFGLTPNLGTISTMMNQRIQNGTTDDVLNALDKLNKNLSNLERPSYNINGITYDDGSNITSAVESLVRAARVERRI